MNNRLVQFCVLAECQNHTGIKLQDDCQYDMKIPLDIGGRHGRDLVSQ